MQIRAMETQEPPVYIVAPGRVFRRETADPAGLAFHIWRDISNPARAKLDVLKKWG